MSERSTAEVEQKEHPLDVARDAVKDVNSMLADTDGKIAAMAFNGAAGYHQYVAKGETDPEYLWRIALLQALDDTIFEMMHVDGDSPAEARRQMERQLKNEFPAFTAEYIADEFESNLEDIIEVQENADQEVEQ